MVGGLEQLLVAAPASATLAVTSVTAVVVAVAFPFANQARVALPMWLVAAWFKVPALPLDAAGQRGLVSGLGSLTAPVVTSPHQCGTLTVQNSHRFLGLPHVSPPAAVGPLGAPQLRTAP